MRCTWPILSLFCLLPLSGAGHAACFKEAAERYQLPIGLLKAISRVESRGNSQALNRNSNGSTDIGHMQINTYWLPKLKKYGISQQSLLNPCTNTYVGAWILAQNIRQLGYNWDAIGAYNASSPAKRYTYAKKIAAALNVVGH